MKEVTIQLKSSSVCCRPLNCECGNVYLHLKPSIAYPIRTNSNAPGDNLIIGTITRITSLGDIDRDCLFEWDYIISYDEGQLQGNDPFITSSDLEMPPCCENCEIQASQKIIDRQLDLLTNQITPQVLRNAGAADIDISVAASSPYELNSIAVTIANPSLNYDKQVMIDIGFDARVITLEDGAWDLSLLRDTGIIKTLRVNNPLTAGETNQWYLNFKDSLITIPANTTQNITYSIEAATTADLALGQAIVTSNNLEISVKGV